MTYSLGRNRRWSVAGIAVLALALLAVFAAATLSPPDVSAEDAIITPQEAQLRAANGDLTIVDIRRPSEWKATGIPTGAERATIDFRGGSRGFLARMATLTDGDKGKPIALICAGGVRSRHAAALLRENGYTAVHDIGQGMLGSRYGKGWLKHQLPVTPCSDC